MAAVPGVEEVTSTSSEGSTRIRLSFDFGTDLEAAAADMRDRIDRAIDRLPDDASRPIVLKFDLAQFPILIMGASSELDPVEMRRIIDDQVKYRLERVPGVAAVDIHGGLDREIHVELDPSKINALDLSIDGILDKIRQGNVNVPAGMIERGRSEVRLRTPGEYTDLAQLSDTVIAKRDEVPVLLREVAEIEDSWEKVRRISRINGKMGVRLIVRKQSGTNTVQVAKGVLRELEKVQRDIPQIEVIPIIDTSEYIENSISNLGRSALFGGVLAILVLLFFLRHLGSTVVITITIPVAIIATFALMYFSGFTLNIMTLGGLALGVGMLVDSAIVVLENIFRLHEQGMSAEEAAVEGAEEVTAAIITSTLTTMVVFLPLLFIKGLSGVMFREFSVVVAFSLLCALVSALTLVPLLTAQMLKKRDERRAARHVDPNKAPERRRRHFLDPIARDYARLLHFALRNRLLVLGTVCAIFVGAVFLIPYVGTELMPRTDEGEVRVYGEMRIGTRVQVLDHAFTQIEKILRRNTPEVESTVSYLGGTSWRSSGSHKGELRATLVKQKYRQRSSDDVAAALRPLMTGIPGVEVRVRPGQGFFLFRRAFGGGDEQLEVEVRGHDLDIADALARRVEEIMKTVPGITDTQVSREAGAPEEQIWIDRRKAADMGLNVSQIADALQTIISGTNAGYFREGGKEYSILVRVRDADKMALRDILDLTLANSDGDPVVLRNVASVRPARGAFIIQRKNQERLVTVSANIAGRDLGSIVADLRGRLDEIAVPRDFSILFGGDFEEQVKAQRELIFSFILALVLVYMVMACDYESLRDPLAVMFSVPLALVGVVAMLLLTDTTFNIQSYIGCIMLAGIVVNNAILLVDHTNLLRRRDGLALTAAIEEAGRRRLRPILMTATTTMLALVPLAIGIGEGGEAQAPLARAVIGGLASSTLITLVIVPVVYSLLERGAHKMQEAPPPKADGSE